MLNTVHSLHVHDEQLTNVLYIFFYYLLLLLLLFYYSTLLLILGSANRD